MGSRSANQNGTANNRFLRQEKSFSPERWECRVRRNTQKANDKKVADQLSPATSRKKMFPPPKRLPKQPLKQPVKQPVKQVASRAIVLIENASGFSHCFHWTDCRNMACTISAFRLGDITLATAECSLKILARSNAIVLLADFLPVHLSLTETYVVFQLFTVCV